MHDGFAKLAHLSEQLNQSLLFQLLIRGQCLAPPEDVVARPEVNLSEPAVRVTLIALTMNCGMTVTTSAMVSLMVGSDGGDGRDGDDGNNGDNDDDDDYDDVGVMKKIGAHEDDN